MTLNAHVSVGGSLTMAVLDPTTSRPIAGFGHDDAAVVYGNRLAAPLRWFTHKSQANVTADLSGLPSRVRLEFNLRAPASIFAWEFHCV
jgi:hypothetical protein